MMRWIAGALCSLFVVVCLAPVATADEIVEIRRVDLGDFPEVSLTVAIAEGEVDPEAVQVQENGLQLSEISVDTSQSDVADVDVVLAIDTSGSMVGAPMTAAKDAAAEFVRGLPENMRVGIVSFADEASVVLQLTTNRQRALGVIAGLVAQGETALYDGVQSAAELFGQPALRNIVLLSDGADTVSTAGLEEALASVKRSKAAVYSVGLESGEFDATSLRRFASSSDGRYSTADAARLADLYSGLAEEISNQFVVTYESTASAGDELEIQLAAAGGVDTTLVLAPKVEAPVEAPGTRGPRTVEPAEPLLSGTTGLIIVIAAVFAAIFLLAFMFLGASTRKRRDQELARRMAASSGQPSVEEEDRGAVEWIPDPFVELGERAARLGHVGAKIDARLERAGIEIRTGEFLAASLLAVIVGVLLALLLLPKPIFVILLAIVAGAAPWLVVSIRADRRLRKLREQLVDILAILASSLRAGHSFMQAIDAVGREIGEPGSREFARLIAEIRLGRDVDEALYALADRIDSEDFRWAVIAVSIQREVGGNLAEVLDTVAETIRDRQNIRRQIDVLSAEGRLSIYVLAGLPILLTIYMSIVNPDYIGLLFSTRIGIVMLVVAAALITLGVLWMRKLVKIDV
jgi:tight adherence protein B